jgi:hypothetical protein
LVLFAAVILLVAGAAVLITWQPGTTQVEPGEIARETYKAPETTTYISEIRTEELRRQARASVGNIVKQYDESILPRQRDALATFLSSADGLRADTAPIDSREAAILSLLNTLDTAEAQLMLQMSESGWESVKAEVTRLVDIMLANRIEGDQLTEVIDGLPSRVSSLLTTQQQRLAVGIAEGFITPNVFIDEQATEVKRQAAADAVTPVVVSVQAGQALVRDGDVVSAEDVEALEMLGLTKERVDWQARFATLGIIGVLTVILTAYLHLFSREGWQDRYLMLMLIVVLFPMLVARVALPNDDLQYMLPIAAASMLLALLVGLQFAAVFSGLLAILVSLVANLDLGIFTIYLAAGLVGALLVWRADRTITFVGAGAGVTLVSFALAVFFSARQDDLTGVRTVTLLAESAVAGTLSASITFLSFGVLGSMFGIVTHLQLQELAHPRQPLLGDLAREAPGTYHHSIVVSNLAESAADSVKADPLFTRVAVLYHDIGKLKNPLYFAENQAGGINIHDGLDPIVSSRIIIDHVRDGVEMAKKGRLPQRIIDVIAQHHGTTRTEYFYRKALDADPMIAPELFSYPGPKPQTKEAAIIMLADSVEASTRAAAQGGILFGGNTEADKTVQLRGMVHQIIQEKIDAGQLDECDLTYRDIHRIEDAFVPILEGMYHPRVVYPSRQTPETEPALVEPISPVTTG